MLTLYFKTNKIPLIIPTKNSFVQFIELKGEFITLLETLKRLYFPSDSDITAIKKDIEICSKKFSNLIPLISNPATISEINDIIYKLEFCTKTLDIPQDLQILRQQSSDAVSHEITQNKISVKITDFTNEFIKKN